MNTRQIFDVNKPGIYPVIVTATDLGNNSVSVEGSIAVTHSLELEARTEPLTAEEVSSVMGVSPENIVFTETVVPNNGHKYISSQFERRRNNLCSFGKRYRCTGCNGRSC